VDVHEPEPFYESGAAFDPQRIRAAAVYCSDGRFGDQCDELMHEALGLPRYDRLAVPGGAACLASHFLTFREEEGVVEQLRFLVECHELQRVVLIAHQDCAFYTRRLRVSPLQLETQQREDMRKAMRRVQRIRGSIQVDGFFARKGWNGRVQFERIQS
jgi:hypothetical protein